EYYIYLSFFFSSRRRHTRFSRDWSSDVCSSDLARDRDRDELPLKHLERVLLREVDAQPRLLERRGRIGRALPGGGGDGAERDARSEERRVGKEGRYGWAQHPV